jgi:uncharacterized membrane protein (DUF4010 family)
VTELVTRQEALDALIFAVCALVILPELPNHAIDPFGVLNPFVLWRLVVLVMGVTGIGYVAQRFVGARYGLALSGFASGFVSSNATIYAMGRRAREQPELLDAAAAGAAASSIATFVEAAILVGAASPSLLAHLAPPFVAGGAVAAAYAALLVWRAARAPVDAPPSGRAFRFRVALAFTAFVATVMFVTKAVQAKLGVAGALAASALAGVVDAHAASAAAAALQAGGAIDLSAAAILVLVALSTNTAAKAIVAFSAGGRAFGVRVVVGLAAMMAAAWIAAAL